VRTRYHCLAAKLSRVQVVESLNIMISINSICHIIILVFLIANQTHAHLLEGIYCGRKNCYDVLNVTRESSRSDISKQYRKLAKIYHPDTPTGDEEKFKEIANANEILKDEEARRDYDYMLGRWIYNK
jgi:DnaJ family protein C protein 25